MFRRRAIALVPVALGALVALAGCAGTVHLDAGPHATAAGCARVVAALPSSIDSSSQRHTDSRGTSAWGDPVDVLLRCGVPPIGPTPQPCITVNGVDWVLLTDPAAQNARYITFGRSPATEILVDHAKISDIAVLPALADAMKKVHQTQKCLSSADDTAPPTPTTTP